MKRCACLVTVFLLLGTFFQPVYAHPSAAEHYQDIRYVLFGDKYYRGSNQNMLQKRQSIEYATQICIDQFGGSHTSMLTLLHERVSATSSISLDDLNLDARINEHRIFTHLGWQYQYSNDARNTDWVENTWPARQDLLRSTTEAIFNFNKMPGFVDQWVKYDARCDSFCALVYYVHVLGDHLEFKYTTYNKVTNGLAGKDQVMPLGSARGDSLISEVIETLDVLFPEQDCSELKRELLDVNREIYTLLDKPEQLTTEAGFTQYHDLAQKVLEILHEHIPGLLKNEEFFNSVFY